MSKISAPASHGVLFLAHNLSLGFFFTWHCCHGNQREVTTVSRALLVKPITHGEVPARSGCRELEQCAILPFVSPYRNCVDMPELKGATFGWCSSASPGGGDAADHLAWAKQGAQLQPGWANSRSQESGECEGRQSGAFLLPQSF